MVVKSEAAAAALPDERSEVETRVVPFAEALCFWVKLGFISFGGPAGQIAIMHRELVERRRWTGEERFLHALNYCMLLPGPEAQQLAIYIGWLMHRTWGGILAAVVLFGLPLWVVVIYLTLSGLNAQLEHANVRLSDKADGLLRLFVVTPNMHKAHHSRLQKETDTNYSNIFSFWDRLCDTYTPRVDFAELRYGLDGFDDAHRQSLSGLLRMPFVKFQ